jgi:heme A synthase
MAAIPAYSVFSASSELLVTAAVFYVLWRAYARGEFRKGLLAAVLSFEALANISYMAYRAVRPSGGADLPGWLTATAALHGLLSLAMFLALVFFAAMAWRDDARGENFFRDHRAATWAFVGLWTVSIVSGEFLFVATYLT